jgi:hypothetical protein
MSTKVARRKQHDEKQLDECSSKQHDECSSSQRKQLNESGTAKAARRKQHSGASMTNAAKVVESSFNLVGLCNEISKQFQGRRHELECNFLLYWISALEKVGG